MIHPILIRSILNTQSKGVGDTLSTLCSINTFLNPVSYLDALKNKKLFAQFDGIFADGSLLVKAIRHLYGEEVERRSFDMTSMAPILFKYAASNGKSVYIVGAKQEEVSKAVSLFQENYKELYIVGYRNGYFFSDEEKETEAKHIVAIAPDFLIVGMGIVAQEEFLLRVKNAGFKGIGFTCGGFISQTARGEADYYPRWIDKANLRFVYRMYKEPHTRQRYFKAAFLFPFYFVREKIFG